MTHTYHIAGMTCAGCEAKVRSALLMLPAVTAVEVSQAEGTATITMDKHISLQTLQQALEKRYTLSATHNEITEQAKSWFTAYKPVLLLFLYITIISMIAAYMHGAFDWMKAMNVFMAGFFLSFSFFKLLDLEAFADSYSMYDIVARKTRAWGYVYPFIELGLGIAYAAGFQPLATNVITLVIMSVSIIGVLQSVLNKRRIRCACLGAVFNLPMSTITIVEDAMMIIMSGIMLATML